MEQDSGNIGANAIGIPLVNDSRVEWATKQSELIMDLSVLSFAVLCTILYAFHPAELYTSIIMVCVGFVTKGQVPKKIGSGT